MIPGYSSIGPWLRKNWWPADPQPFTAAGGHRGHRRQFGDRRGNRHRAWPRWVPGCTWWGARRTALQIVGRPRSGCSSRTPSWSCTRPTSAIWTPCAGWPTTLTDRARLAACPGALRRRDAAGAQGRPPQGHEMAFATHVLGPLLLTVGLRPLLQADGDGRVVFVSSGGMYTAAPGDRPRVHRGRVQGGPGVRPDQADAGGAGRATGRGLHRAEDPVVHSMHPGWVATPGVSDSIPDSTRSPNRSCGRPSTGADTIVWLVASPEAAQLTGRFWRDRRVRPDALSAVAAGRPGGPGDASGRPAWRRTGATVG